MVRSEKCLRRWYLSMGRLSEWWLSRWTLCKSRLSHHRLREGSLKLDTLYLEWGNVKLRPSLLIATLTVYSTFHLSNLHLFFNSRMCLSLSSGQCWCSLYFSHLKTIWGLLKFYHPHGLIIIIIMCWRPQNSSLYSGQRRHPWILWQENDHRGVHKSCSRNMQSCASSSNIPNGSVSQSK